MNGNFFWRREVLLNGLQLVVGQEHDVWRDNDQWRFRFKSNSGDVIQERLYVFGLLVSVRLVPVRSCQWEMTAAELAKSLTHGV